MKKIFGIGLSRTGTTSLAQVLTSIGINFIHYPKTKEVLFDSKNGGGGDLPAVVYYKELDIKFPNSLFVYTIRDKEEWLDSVENHLTRKDKEKIKPWSLQNRIAVYGQIEFDRDVFSAIYDTHDADVRSYFKDRKQDLLILNICGGDGIYRLLSFIDAQNDKTLTFPQINKRIL